MRPEAATVDTRRAGGYNRPAMRRRASILLLLLAALAAAHPSLVEARRKEKVFRIAGVGQDERGKPVPVEVLSAVQGGIRISIRYLEHEEAGRALSSVLEGAGNLFRPRTESDRGHLVFALQIENQGGADIIYEPGQGRLITDRTDAEFPMDYTMLYRLLQKIPGGAPPLDEVEKAVYSRATTIRPGGAVRKLLVFEGPRDGKFKKLEVRVGSLQTSERELDPRFKFRKFEVEP